MSQQVQITFIALGIIALILLIIALFYAIIAFRKIGIVSKKTDYLVEDVTYKSEMLMPTVEALTRLSKYSDLLEEYVSENSKFTYDFLKKHAGKLETKKSKSEVKTESKK
ncbi:MAG: hypothetical protein K2L48_05005 [Mycoplasmoidaceae bacterium]|nr:hypothetical protein [Mycoplasmoidaceae bacterium]